MVHAATKTHSAFSKGGPSWLKVPSSSSTPKRVTASSCRMRAAPTSSCTFPRSSAPACVRWSRARSCRSTSRLTAAAASRPRPTCRRPELRHKCSAGVILAPAFCFLSRRKRRRIIMPRKPGLNSEFVMFDVVYEDGTQRSNRKVPRALLGGLDGDKPAHGFLIEQDREIAEKSGRPPAKIQSISRSGAKKKVKDYA